MSDFNLNTRICKWIHRAFKHAVKHRKWGIRGKLFHLWWSMEVPREERCSSETFHLLRDKRRRGKVARI